MAAAASARILPYSLIVGQDELKLALELAYIAPSIGGVLISGQRGTAKSTAVRAFSTMMYEQLPVTLPINATDDRVIGGWKIDELMRGDPQPQPGLLEEASEHGVLYIDEVNLLDDHIVNLILDVSSTGVLPVQREGLNQELYLSFTLIGTMNPEEGGLRPQLLDRFGLMVSVAAEIDLEKRRQILERVLALDEVKAGRASSLIADGVAIDQQRRAELLQARKRFHDVVVGDDILAQCARLAVHFQVASHRGDVVMALAARACAANSDANMVTIEHVQRVAPLALQHRRPSVVQGGRAQWSLQDSEEMERLLRSGPV
jgi:magnesium chelatase subunit I